MGVPGSAGATHFGFVAEDTGSLTVDGTAIALKASPSNDGPLPIGATRDVDLFEVP